MIMMIVGNYFDVNIMVYLIIDFAIMFLSAGASLSFLFFFMVVSAAAADVSTPSVSKTIKISSPLFEFRSDPRFDSILEHTYPQTVFPSFSSFQSLLSHSISQQPSSSMRNIAVYIQGKFQPHQVTVTHSLILYYEQIIEAWYRLKGDRKIHLELWLRGEGGLKWVEALREKLDFDEIEMVAVDGIECRALGKEKYNLMNCNKTRVSYGSRVIDGSIVGKYQVKGHGGSEIVITINYVLKVYISRAMVMADGKNSSRVVVFGKDYFEYGTLVSYNDTGVVIIFTRANRQITVNSTTLVSRYLHRPLAQVYNCVNRSMYYGGWHNNSFHGFGYQIAQKTEYKYIGSYRFGNKHGKGIVVICNKSLSPVCQKILASRQLNTSEDLYNGTIFIGDFENNWRKVGVHRKSHQLELGRYGYYYNTTYSDRLYLTMKLNSFSIRYSLQVYNGYAERRLLGLFVDGVLKRGYVQTCYLRMGDGGSPHQRLVAEYNSSGVFNENNQVVKGVREDLQIVAFGDFFISDKKMIVMTRKSTMSLEISELYYGNINRWNKKEGKSIAYTEDYAYFGEFEDDFINGYGNKTEFRGNVSWEGYFEYGRFVEGVAVEGVTGGDVVREGGFIGGRLAEGGVRYWTGSHLLVEGGGGHRVISTAEEDLEGQESFAGVMRVIADGWANYFLVTEQ